MVYLLINFQILLHLNTFIAEKINKLPYSSSSIVKIKNKKAIYLNFHIPALITSKMYLGKLQQ